MELCLVGLFLLIQNDRDAFTGVGQAVVMIIATTLMVIYQILLENNFLPILRYLPASTVCQDGGVEEVNRNHYSMSSLTCLQHLAHRYYGWMRPSGKVPQDLQESIEELARNELNSTD